MGTATAKILSRSIQKEQLGGGGGRGRESEVECMRPCVLQVALNGKREVIDCRE